MPDQGVRGLIQLGLSGQPNATHSYHRRRLSDITSSRCFFSDLLGRYTAKNDFASERHGVPITIAIPVGDTTRRVVLSAWCGPGLAHREAFFDREASNHTCRAKSLPFLLSRLSLLLLRLLPPSRSSP